MRLLPGRATWASVLAVMLIPPQALAWFSPHTVLPSRCNHNFNHNHHPYGWRGQRSKDSSFLETSSTSASGAATAASSAADSGTSTAPPPSQNGISAETGSPLPPLPPSPPPPSALSSQASLDPISWQQARFSVTLPPPRDSGDRHRGVTKAVTNGLAPLLEGCPAGEGVGLLQVLNGTASLAVSPSAIPPPPETGAATNYPTTSAVILTLRDGNTVWPEGQELWLSLAESDSNSDKDIANQEERSSSDSADPIYVLERSSGGGGLPESSEQRGSSRYDFSVLWSVPSGESAGGESRSLDVGMESENRVSAASHDTDTTNVSGSGRGQGVGEGEKRTSADNARGMGPSGGHVVGELRPLNEFSAVRQEALDEALETVGVDPRELTEADEFFGTAALKSYNTFVRPRPKQLAKVMQEPVARAALRTAHQVAFLVRRHRADRAEYLRNKDASMTEAERQGLVAHPVVLVCDNVRSAYNVGSIFRSADTARAAEVISCGFTPHPGGHGEDKVRKTAFGSIDAVNHRHFEDPAEAIRSLKAQGAFVCALETTEGASSLFDVRFPLPPSPGRKGIPRENDSVRDDGKAPGTDGGFRDSATAAEKGGGDGGVVEKNGGEVGLRPAGGGEESEDLEEGGVVALVLGNEVTGVDERVLGLCDLVVEVPVFGLKNSLNVASAGTVVLYEVLRQWSQAGRLAGDGG